MSESVQKPRIRFKGFSDAWEQRKLGDIGSVSMCRRIFKEQTSESGEIPFYKIGTFGGEADAFISRELFDEYKDKYPYPKKGDILISASGSIGRTIEFTGKNEYFQDSNIVWLNHDEHLDNSFLKCFYSVVKWAGIEGSTIKRLYNDNILNTVITLPSIAEQKKIATYFESLDNLITLHQREFFRLFGASFCCNSTSILPISWEQRKLGEVSPLRGGFAFKSEEYLDAGIPVVRISNILTDGTVGADFAYYNRIENDENMRLHNGDAVLAMSGATTGKVSILHCKNDDIYYQNQRVGYFTYNKNYDYKYISIIVRSPKFIDQLSSVLVAGAQPNVSSKDIESFEFKFPTEINEQSKIGKLFEQLDNLITLHQCECLGNSHALSILPSPLSSRKMTSFWEQRKLGDVVKEVTRNDPTSDAPIMMITANNGFIEQSERYAFNNAGESLKKYILLEKGELAYNHGASKLRPYGSCFALTTSKNARIPFVYHCFSANEQNSEFLSIELNGTDVENQLRRIVSSGARMDGLLNISFQEYATISVLLPNIEEQNKIAALFSDIDNLITLHQRIKIFFTGDYHDKKDK